MTRPQIVRAGKSTVSKYVAWVPSLTSISDTLDLQDTNAPSAKDHSRQPTNPGALGEGPPAPHQANALKSAGLEGIELRSRSPRASQDLSGKEIQLLQNHDESEEASNSNLEDADIDSHDIDIDEDDEEMEDDMMDKISSSPSIDDGRSTLFNSAPSVHCFGCCGIEEVYEKLLSRLDLKCRNDFHDY